MRKYMIVRKRQLSLDILEEYRDETVFLRIEPNGNLFWSIHELAASSFKTVQEIETALEKIDASILPNCFTITYEDYYSQ